MTNPESPSKKHIREPSKLRTAMLGTMVFAVGYFSHSAQHAVSDADKNDAPQAGKTAALPTEQPTIPDRNPATHAPKNGESDMSGASGNTPGYSPSPSSPADYPTPQAPPEAPTPPPPMPPLPPPPAGY